MATEPRAPADMWVQIDYLNAIEGGSGTTRMWLDRLPEWLSARNGVLVRRITVLHASPIGERRPTTEKER